MTAKTVAVGLAVVLMMVGGAAAVTAGPAAQSDAQTQTTDAGTNATAPGDADIGATYDNGTVTVTVTQGGEPVENASVELNEEEYTTDANGTVVAEYDGHAYLEIEAETGGFEGEVKYNLVDDSLLIHEEEYEYKYGGNYENEEEHEYENEQEHEYENEEEEEHEYENEQEREYENEQEEEREDNDEMEDDDADEPEDDDEDDDADDGDD